MSILRQLKLKDFFTALNLFVAYYAVLLVFQDKFAQASALIFINVIFLDLIDGWVSRITNTYNELGKHFDSIVDFISSSVAVCFFIYVSYQEKSIPLAIAISFIPLLTGVLREIKSRIENIKVETYFIGFPRNSSSLLLVAFLNSSLMSHSAWIWIGMIFILATSYMQLSHAPYICNDKSKLKLQTRIKVYLIICIVAQIILTFLGLFWDGVLTWMTVYLISPFIIVEKSVWNNIREQVTNKSVV